MKQGTYSENLKSGGTLQVSATRIEISYYFRGPDMRYNGKVVNISSNEFDKYIAAFKDNFEKYKELKEIIKEGSFNTIGACQMSIHVGYPSLEGVDMSVGRHHHHFFPIRNEERLNQIISDFEYAKIRGIEVQSLLFGN